ncbi:polysaccharide pyruvyl transferase family protein [Rhizobium terrae]|uniref:polysaccharide pyruvyl transferase family protein n=1 Tax=Rhizobium terrae TaxID=2171756 RepID=UPI000E3C4683|nr:polysaccharide pyruvyl transferase family protein [Rhizobium terrae]
MKIGILTYHDTNNYGAQLQAASIQQFLAAEGFDAELIDFRPLRYEIRRSMPLFRALIRLNFRSFLQQARVNTHFRNAIFDMAKISKHSAFLSSQVPQIALKYDVLICGSDELWNFGNFRGYMSPYILDFPVKLGVRKISYAASIGPYVPSGSISKKMEAALKQFSRILVRDPPTLELVSKFGFQADRVVDPTFLTDLNPIKPDIAPYLMLSGGMTKTQVDQSLKAADILKLRPISVGVEYPGHANICVRATPREWIGFVKHASYHITSLFHGAALSLKYETRFCVFRTPGKEQKIMSLLEWMDASSRSIDPSASGEDIARVVSEPLSPKLPDIRDRHVSASRDLLLSTLAGHE